MKKLNYIALSKHSIEECFESVLLQNKLLKHMAKNYLWADMIYYIVFQVLRIQWRDQNSYFCKNYIFSEWVKQDVSNHEWYFVVFLHKLLYLMLIFSFGTNNVFPFQLPSSSTRLKKLYICIYVIHVLLDEYVRIWYYMYIYSHS